MTVGQKFVTEDDFGIIERVGPKVSYIRWARQPETAVRIKTSSLRAAIDAGTTTLVPMVRHG
jgi:hypothetical protein